MIKLSTVRTTLVATAATAAVGIIAAAAAYATVPTYKITAGTKTSGTIDYTAAATGTSAKPAIKFRDTAGNGTDLNCVSGTAKGVMKLGAHVSGTKAGTITGSTWTSCHGPFNLALKPKQVGTWYINGSARPVNGVTKVFVNNVKANVTSAAGCNFTVSGSVDGTYNNTSGRLNFAPRAGSGHVLRLSNVNTAGCFNLLHNKDKATFRASYLVKTAKGRIKIR